MPAITEATAKALVAYPQVNVSVEGYNILFKKHINVGIAVSQNDGNLIVPVVRDADRLNLSGLAIAIDGLAAKARVNKLTPDDIAGGDVYRLPISARSSRCSVRLSSISLRSPYWE